MHKTTLDTLKQLTATDTKSLSQKALKAAEEVGELAKVVLPFEGAHATTHRFVDKRRILEEVVDVILCVRSIGYELGFDDAEIEDMVIHKMRKWAELQAREKKANYPVPYEFHITVRTKEIERFKQTCAALGVKPIVLDLQNQQGDSVMHDVMTSSTFIGDNPGAYHEMERIAVGLSEASFEVIRKKIETVPWHPAAPDDPETEEDDQEMPKDCYFECHFGIVCDEESRPVLQQMAKDIDAHLSRNIFKRLGGDTFKIMLTARSYSGSATGFQARVKAIEAHIKEAGFDVDKVIVEFSVYDTKVSHDSSWITSAGAVVQ
jgi:NTP pyrophosphatase (non-canonical NTP hydrolase)